MIGLDYDKIWANVAGSVPKISAVFIGSNQNNFRMQCGGVSTL